MNPPTTRQYDKLSVCCLTVQIDHCYRLLLITQGKEHPVSKSLVYIDPYSESLFFAPKAMGFVPFETVLITVNSMAQF